MKNKIFLGLLLFLSFASYRAYAAGISAPDYTVPDSCPTGEHQQRYAIDYTTGSGSAQYHVAFWSGSSSGVQEHYYQVPGSEAPFISGYYQYDIQVDRFSCVPDPFCESPMILESLNGIDGQLVCVDDAPPCTDPDVAFTDVNGTVYSIVSDVPTSCSVDSGYLASMETSSLDCVKSYRCAIVDIDADDDGVNDDLDTDSDNDGYSDAQELLSGTDPFDPFSNGGETGIAPDGGGDNSGAGGGGTSSGTDTSSSCASTCGVTYGICVQLNRQLPTYELTWQDCTDCNDWTGEYSGYCPVLSNDELCSGVPKKLHEEYNYDCTTSCEAGYERSSLGGCTIIIDVPNDCDHTAIDAKTSFPFQEISASYTECRNAIMANGGKGFQWPLASCDAGDYACYYTSDPSENSMDESLSDANTSTTDLNNSAVIDDTNIVNGLSNIEKRIDRTNSTLDRVDESINSQTSVLNSSLSALTEKVGQSGENVRDAVNSANRDIGSKLLGIESAIANKGTGETDMTATNDLLAEIKDEIQADHTTDEAGVNSGFSEIKTAGENAVSSYTNMFSNIKANIEGVVPPNMSVSGGCTALTFSFRGESVNLATGIDSMMAYISTIFMLILNLSFTFIVIRLSVLAFNDVTKRIQWLFI